MIKVVIFDFWGTLVEIGVFPSPIKQVRSILGLYRLPYPLFILQFERSFMLKEFEDLYGAFTEVCREFRREPRQELLDSLVGIWNKNKLLAKPFPETFEALEELKKRFKLALLSNTDCFSVQSVLEKYDLEKYFDSIVLSYKAGLLKINPEIYNKVLSDLDVSKEECVMVGDCINSDIKSAERAGIRGILIDRRNSQEFDDKVIDLKELLHILD